MTTDGKAYHTDKIDHGYHPVYSELAGRMRMPRHAAPDRAKWIVEVGTSHAGGLDYFNDVFAHNLKFGVLAGVDQRDASRNPFGPMLHHNQESMYLAGHLRDAVTTWASSSAFPYRGANGAFYEAIKDRCYSHGPIWDLIIDDASHEYSKTAATLHNLWPELRPGGFYVIEDWNHAGGLLYPLARDLVETAFHEARATPAGVARIEFHHGLIVISKMGT